MVIVDIDQPVLESTGAGSAAVPMASVHAASKAALSSFTEALHQNLVGGGTPLRASLFHPSGDSG